MPPEASALWQGAWELALDTGSQAAILHAGPALQGAPVNTSPLWASCSSIVETKGWAWEGGTPAVDTIAGSLVEGGGTWVPLRPFEWVSSGLWSGAVTGFCKRWSACALGKGSRGLVRALALSLAGPQLRDSSLRGGKAVSLLLSACGG